MNTTRSGGTGRKKEEGREERGGEASRTGGEGQVSREEGQGGQGTGAQMDEFDEEEFGGGSRASY